jgi:hypothetical protein
LIDVVVADENLQTHNPRFESKGSTSKSGWSTTDSQPAAAQADADDLSDDDLSDMDAGDANSQSFVRVLSGPCGTRAHCLCLVNRVSAERLGLAAHSASDLTTFLQISSITGLRNSRQPT